MGIVVVATRADGATGAVPGANRWCRDADPRKLGHVCCGASATSETPAGKSTIATSRASSG